MARRRGARAAGLPPVVRFEWLRLWALQAGPTGPGKGQLAKVEGSVG